MTWIAYLITTSESFLQQLPLDLYEFALLAALLHALTLSGFMVYLPARRRAPSNACTPARGHGGHTAYSASRPHAHSQCERCGRDLSAHEERWGKRLCDRCWDTWGKAASSAIWHETLVVMCL
eukprot:scaffold71330_cov32-Tisochrysis_lutea.AAC.5